MEPVEPTYRRFTTAGAFTDAECERLCEEDRAFSRSGVQVDTGGAAAADARSSSGAQLAHAPATDWLVERMHHHVLRLNVTFQFELSGWSAPQILRYQIGQRYDWHVDMGRDEVATRKLSAIVLLSDAAAYEGGDLEWMPDLGACSRARGTLILFPSFVPHRVTPVLSGERYAMVAWVHGDRPFR